VRLLILSALVMAASCVNCGLATGLDVDGTIVVSDAGGGVDAGSPDASVLVWPNEVSTTNSDRWLVEHHDEVQRLEPRVLVVNFVAGRDAGELRSRIDTLVAAYAEGSRYHGMDEPQAPVFLQYRISHFADLAGQPTRTNDGGAFGYDEFVRGQAFADKVAFPSDAGRALTMCELFERGLINEAWVIEPAADPAKLFETKTRGQRYDTNFNALPGRFDRCAGNGCMPDIACGVTVRLQEINPDRGPGCMVHAAGHAIEGQLQANTVPWFTTNASRFFMFDFRTRYGTTFPSFYVCPYSGERGCMERPAIDRARSLPDSGVSFDLQTGVGCGNVHFAPHSRGHYDMEEPSAGVTGLATCRGYGLGAGDGGTDATELIDYSVYRTLNRNRAYSDCGGGWQIYLRQSMPGLGNRAKDTMGRPMKNWWPFLFY